MLETRDRVPVARTLKKVFWGIYSCWGNFYFRTSSSSKFVDQLLLQELPRTAVCFRKTCLDVFTHLCSIILFRWYYAWLYAHFCSVGLVSVHDSGEEWLSHLSEQYIIYADRDKYKNKTLTDFDLK